MRYKQITFFAVLIFSLAISVAAFAHHGGAWYDRTKTLSLTGTITNYQLANPHSTVSFDVKGENGKIQHWSAEFGYLRDLLAKGWRLDTLKPGDQVTVRVYPLKNGAPVGSLQKITYADGRPLNLKPGGDGQ